MNSEYDLERQRQEEEEKKSRIESARDNLYRHDAPAITHRQPDGGRLPHDEDEQAIPSQAFIPPVKSTFDKEKVAGKVNKVFRHVFVAAVIFFVLSLGVAAFMYFYGNNTISSRNIDMEVIAPPSVPSSDTFSFDISMQNGNNADLINAVLVIDYPEGSREVEDNAMPLVSERIDIGTIGKGQIVKRTTSARLFGEENAEKDINVRLEYQVDNSNAHFKKEQSFKVILRLAPVIVSIDALKEVNTNQEVVLKAKISSNSNNTLRNVALNVTYPFGFTYAESNLEVESGPRGEFPIGDLQPNESKEVVIRGKINGQSAEEKIFKFNVGTANSEGEAKVTTLLATLIHDMTIRADFLASSVSLTSGKEYAAFGSPIRGNISWKNTLPYPIYDARFTMKISGDLVDTSSVSSDRGYYDSNKALMEWDKNTDSQLDEIAGGQSGAFSFSIDLFSYADAIAQRISNPKATLDFDIEGRRITEDNVTENIRSSFTKTIPIVTTVGFTSKTLRNTGPMQNSGPLPPKAETKSTFTVALSLTNSVN
jgi:hypothetical protein